ncbi:MAG TPA: ABC transporter permease [Vicinamibacterales bacterium]|jgi:predicted permease|nr:ABC transporter permease [Vicinamibacterales bacterium]
MEILQDVRYTFRTLRQKPGFAVVTLLILALGIGGTTVMFTVINSVLLRPLSYPEPDRLVMVRGFTGQFGEFSGISNLDFLDTRRESRSLRMAAWNYGGGTISQPGEPEYVDGRQISAEVFSVLGIPLLRGRSFRPDEDRQGAAPVAIISYELWQRRFGGSEATVGQTMAFDGKTYTIVGVMPRGFQLDGDSEVFTPLAQNGDRRMENRNARFLRAIARLQPGASLEEAQTEIGLIAIRLAKEYRASNENLGLRLRSLQEQIVGDVGSTVWLLLAAVSMVLLIACVNIAGLLLARAVSREHEFAMRAALGASRSRLARQCLSESAVLGLSGGLLGVVLAAMSIRPFVALWPGSLPRESEIGLDWRVGVFALVVSLLSGVLVGLVPALRIREHSLVHALRTGARTIAGQTRRTQGALVIAEITLAVVLLVSAGMLGRTLLALSSLNPGLNVSNVLTSRFALSPSSLTSPEQIRAAWQDVLDRAGHVTGVESVTLADIIPMREGINTLPYSTTAAQPAPNETPVALTSTVTANYLKVMGIPLRRGRFFDEHDGADTSPVVVIDDNLAQHAFGKEDPVGKRLWVAALGPVPVQIIGVVGHVRHFGLAGDDQSRVRDQMYYPFAQVPGPLLRFFSSVMSIALRTTVAPMNVVEPLRHELRGASNDQAMYEVRTMEQLVSASLARQRFLLMLFGAFAAVALLLACVGIYGALAYLVGQRIPEFGVRMALGATGSNVMGLVMRESVGLIAGGVAFGSVGAWAAGRLLGRLVQGMRPTEPITVIAMAGVLVAAALLASFVPAFRASRVDAIRALGDQ